MATYNCSIGGLPQASDVNQLVDIFSGKHDVGTITFAPQLSAPPTTGISLTAQSGSTLGVGAYQYVVTYVTGYYQSNGTLVKTGETTVSSAVSITTTANNTTIKITLPTTGLPASAVAFNIYRTAVGGSTYGLIATVKFGNSSYTDSTADGSRGAANPTTNTTGTNLTMTNTFATSQLGTLAFGHSDEIWGTYGSSGTGNLYVNFRSYDGTTNNFMDTYIGNGKGTVIFTAHGGANSISTKNNTLDDGSGNMILTGAIELNNAKWIQGKDASGSYHGMMQIDASNRLLLNQDSGMGGIFTALGGVVKNTLDDGNGNMTVGTLKFSNAQGIYTDIYGNFLSPSGVGTGSYWHFNDKSSNSVFNVYIDGTKKISTANNTLDDGSGNATIAGVSLNSNGIRNVQIADTRSVYDIPYSGITQQKSVSADFKSNTVSWLPGGSNGYAGVLTVAPWTDSSGGYPHQLAFNNDGELYHRMGTSVAKSTWSPSTAYALNAYAQPTSAHINGHYYIVTVAGTSGTTEPTWPTTAGATVTDGTVTWKESGTYWNTWTRLIDDDGAGNVTISGYVKAANLYMTGAGYITPQSGGQVGFINNAISSWGLRVVDGANPATYTNKNTLDDGSGNATFAGNMTVSGTLQSAFNSFIGDSTNGWVKFAQDSNYVYLQGINGAKTGSKAIALTGLNAGAVKVVTQANTLDDGTGKATFLGSLVTLGASSINQLFFSPSTYGNPFIVGNWASSNYWGIGPATNTNDGTLQIGLVNQSGSPYAWLTPASTFKLKVGGQLSTLNNTLDDGSGNMHFVGTGQVDGAFTLGSSITTKAGTSSGGTLHFSMQNSGSLRFGFGLINTEASGNVGSDFGIWNYDNTGALINPVATPPLKITRSTSAVSTLKNTLDDGNGAMSVTKLTAQNIQHGTSTCNINGNGQWAVTVTFPHAFASGLSVDVVAVINNSSSPQLYGPITLGNITSTGFQFTVNVQGGGTAPNVMFSWVAIAN